MKNLLIKLFIKDYKNVNNLKVRRRYGTLGACFGIISNLLISSLKMIIGIVFNMVSFIADGVNNLSDAFSSVVSLISFKISSKPADKDHPFGHARMEYVASFIIALFIDFVGIELIIQSINKIIDNHPINNDFSFFIISVIVLSISILLKLYQCYFNYSLGKIINSSTLKLTAMDSRNDVIATSVILIGLIISYFSHFNLDGYLGIAVGLFILISSIKSVIEVVNQLIGQSPEKEVIDSFVKKVTSYEGVLGIHDLQMHSYGISYTFATCHVEIDSKRDILESHEMIDIIENDVFKELNIHTVLHMDPIVLNDPELESIKNDIRSIIKSYNFKLGFHDFRIIKGPTFTNVIFDLVVPEKMPIKEDDLIKEIKTKAKEVNPRYNLVIKVDQDFEDLARG